MITVITDITDRKQAEEALRESEERFRMLVESAPEAIFVRTGDCFSYLNAAAVRLFGAENAGQLLGKPVLDRRQAGFRERARQGIDALAERGESTVSVEEVLLRLDGTEVPAIISAVPIAFEGKLSSLVFAQDYSEQKRALDELRESEERFRALVEGAPDGVFIQQEGRYVYVNTAMAAILGAEKPQDLLGVEAMATVAPEYRDAFRSRMRAQPETGAPVTSLDSEMLRLDGSRVPVETSGVAFRFGGQLAHLVFVRDRTERRKAEGEREILQDQLLQAQKMESVGRLAGGVAHDFNNILMVQKGYCELIRPDLAEGSALRQAVEQIEAYVDRASNLTRQLLAFSRRQPMQPVAFDLNDLVPNMTEMLRRLIGEDVQLTTQLCADPAMILADKGQIEQVLVNLAVNARDAMPGGGKLNIEVAARRFEEREVQHHLSLGPGPYVVLSVSDTGHGMDAETRRRIFEPFFTTKAEGKGTGLGLAMVYGIVRQSGGDILVQSELGRGSTFTVFLPRVEADTSAVEKRETEMQRGSGELILVVEDEPVLRRLSLLMLERLGYRAFEAADGDEAVRVTEEEGLRPDLVLTDVVIPGMSGRALADRLRTAVPGVKVVFMSGYTDDKIADRGVLDAGVNFLQKPFSTRDLAAAIKLALG